MSDLDEIMDFEYQSDEDEDRAYLKLSKQCKRKHRENSEYPKKLRTTSATDDQRTKTEENHSLSNLDDNREENGKNNEETDQSTDNKYSRKMYRNKRVLAVVPEMSKNGWVLFVNSLHEEVTEVEVRNLFAEYGEICDIRLNMCRRTGFVAGYALIQYNTYADALKAKEALHNTEFLGRNISVDWCFLQKPKA